MASAGAQQEMLFRIIWQPTKLRFKTESTTVWAQLVVSQSQIAVFVKDGQIADIFATDRCTLSSKNLPILGKLLGIPFGRETPFKAEVYYLNKSIVMDTKIDWSNLQLLPTIQLPDDRFEYHTFHCVDIFFCLK